MLAPSRLSCELPCIHCGEPTLCESGTEAEAVFCCNGCRGAYQLIQDWGLDEYYGIRDVVSATTGYSSRPNKTSEEDSAFSVFDQSEFLGDSAPTQNANGLLQTKLAVHGLHCAACAWLIENAAKRHEGWTAARVRLADHTVSIEFDSDKTKLSDIARFLNRFGYELAPLHAQGDQVYTQQSRALLINIAIAAFCATNAMWIAIGIYAGEASWLAVEHRTLLRALGTFLGVTAVVIPGRVFFKGAIAAIKTRTPHMDLPVALGLGVGSIAGIVNAIFDVGETYFDSLAALVFLLLVGRWIQYRQQYRAAKSIDLLLRITPQHAHKVREDGSTFQCLVSLIRQGDRVRVAPGQSIPVDGRIVSGSSTLDRSLLTGESVPIEAMIGDSVQAGTQNVSQTIEVETSATGSETKIGQVMRLVESAAFEKTPIIQLADRIGGVFVVCILVLAIATFMIWFPKGFGSAASHATALLIVACPCALALATPLAIAVSLGRAAKRGIFIRDGQSLQRLSKPGTIWFDKTGTLTEGRAKAKLEFGSSHAFAIASALEKQCHHPIAEAFRRANVDEDLSLEVDLLQTEPGGLLGTFRNSSVAVGNQSFLLEQGCAFESRVQEAFEACLERGATPIGVAIDRVIHAVVSVSDSVRPHAIETVRALQQSGWKVGILSGDHARIVNQVAAQVGIESNNAHGDLMPDDKLEFIRKSNNVSTVMIGDGANDAAALAAAGVGIAVRGGADVSLQAAPVFVSSGQISDIHDLVSASKRSTQLIYMTFVASLTYNLIAVGLAMTGMITPLLAAILMPVSSVSVLLLTLLWPTFRKSIS